MMAPTSPSSLHGLLDLPASWMRALIRQHLDADTRRAVMRASQRCCGLGLGASSSCRLTLKVGRLPTPAQRTVRRLVLQHAPRIKLWLRLADQSLDRRPGSRARQMARLLADLDAAGPGWRELVCDVHVQSQDGLPSLAHTLAWLKATFPSVGEVRLWFYSDYITLARASAVLVPSGPLPGITRLTMSGRIPSFMYANSVQRCMAAAELAAPALQHLELVGASFDLEDGGFERLLRLPALTHLTLDSLGLARSHAAATPASGRWQALRIEFASVATLAHLPLPHVEELRIGGLECEGDADAALCGAAAANMRHCRSCSPLQESGALGICLRDGRHLPDLLQQLLPRFTRVQRLDLSGTVTPGTTAALRDASLPRYITAIGVSDCMKGGAHRLLLPALAAGAPSVRSVSVHGEVSRQQLAALCASANAPITVLRERGYDREGEVRAQVAAAMHTAGHSHVTLELVKPGRLRSDDAAWSSDGDAGSESLSGGRSGDDGSSDEEGEGEGQEGGQGEGVDAWFEAMFADVEDEDEDEDEDDA